MVPEMAVLFLTTPVTLEHHMGDYESTDRSATDIVY